MNVRPVVTPSAMQAIDAAADVPLEVLIARAGWAVAHSARRLLGGTYGRRVVVCAGKGNNGADGAVAARQLERWGAHCRLVAADELPTSIDRADLVIDACYGTGFRGQFRAPDVGDSPVLAVDIPSGVDGLTGAVSGRPFVAHRTITFAAPKPGLLLQPGSGFVGTLEVADIGLSIESTPIGWVGSADVAARWPRRPDQAHKWQSAVWVIGGGPGMSGAPRLAAGGAARSGSGYVLLSIPGSETGLGSLGPVESVFRPLSPHWSADVLAESARVGAVVLGPGLPPSEISETRRVVDRWPGPIVLDAGALDAVVGQQTLLRGREVQAVLTPHDGEFARLAGRPSDPDRSRIDTVVDLAADYGAVVLLKGPTTVIAAPDGRSWLSTAGDARLATAGSGDVLAGVIGAGLAMGLAPEDAAVLGAELHGSAAKAGWSIGLVASDLPHLIAAYLSAVVGR